MTTARSTRRAAETNLIDAAIGFVDHGRSYSDLEGAVADYTALGLTMPDQHVTGNANPATSHEAGASLPGIVGDARKVFDEIVLGGGLTCDQVEQKMNRSHQTISARVNQLRDKGWIVDSGLRRLTRSGRKAIVWRPTLNAINQEGIS